MEYLSQIYFSRDRFCEWEKKDGDLVRVRLQRSTFTQIVQLVSASSI